VKRGRPGDAAAGSDPAARVHEAALRLLGDRARSEQELRQRLVGRGFDDALVESEIGRLRRAGLVDDAAFAAAWVEERARLAPRGARALRYELRKHGIAPHLAEAVTTEVDDREAALQLARARARSLSTVPYESFVRRLGGHLQRRGIDAGTAAWATRRAWDETRAASEPDPLDP